MENIVAWFCGFVTAYLMIAAIRSFGSRAVVVVGILSISILDVSAQNSYKRWNSSANPLYWEASFGDPPCTFSRSFLGAGQETSCAGNFPDGTQISVHVFSGNSCGEYLYTVNVELSGGGCTTVDIGSGGSQPDPDVWSYEVSVTNTNQLDGMFTLDWYDSNGELIPELSGGQEYLEAGASLEFTWETDNSDYADATWVVMGPGDISTDFVPKIHSQGGGTNLGPNEGDPEPTPSPDPPQANDPFENLPQYEPTATNELVAARQNAQGIVKAIGELRGDLKNGVSDGLLKQIATNTAALDAQYKDTRSETNSWFGTVTGWSAETLTQTGSNFVMNSGLGPIFTDGGNEPAGWADVNSLSTSINQAGITVSSGEISKFISLDAFAVRLSGPLEAIGNFVKRWFVWVVLWVLFWCVWGDMFRQIRHIEMFSSDLKPNANEVWSIKAKTAISGFLLPLTIALVAVVPTFGKIILDGYWNPWLGPGFENDLNQTGVLGDVGVFGTLTWWVRWVFIVQAMFIPWETIFFAFGNYIVWLITSEMLTRAVVAAFRLMRLIAVWFVLGVVFLHGVNLEAGEVQLENFWTNSVLLTSGSERILVPQGTWQLNLSDGQWTFGASNFEVQEPYLSVVRIAEDGSLASSKAYGAIDAFMLGWYCGIGVFGFAWVVSAVRQGIMLRSFGGGSS